MTWTRRKLSSGPSPLRQCISAGEALSPELFKRWKERFGTVRLDGIGTIEILLIFISHQARRVKPGSSGMVVPGHKAKIVDEAGGPVETGDIGSLLVRRESSCAHYWNQHDKTKQINKAEWIVTGDKYLQAQDGYDWYAGRADDILKAGGIWVSPVEVENTLIQRSVVLEAAVVGHEDDDRRIKLKAFAVLIQGSTASPALEHELKGLVKDKIAPYQCPRWTTFIPQLAMTATVKIQRFTLREHWVQPCTPTFCTRNATAMSPLLHWERKKKKKKKK